MSRFFVVAGLILITGTAAAEEDPLAQGNSPVDQNILRVEDTANGTAVSSPGVISGNVIQVPDLSSDQPLRQHHQHRGPA